MGWLATLFGAGDAQATGDALDAQLAAINKQRYEEGKISLSAYQQTVANLETGDTGSVEGSIALEGAKGAVEIVTDPQQWAKDTQTGAAIVGQAASDAGKAVSKGINSILKETVKDVFGAVPWQIWVLGGLALVLYIGGPAIRKSLAKAAA